ncbi:hypothetical protein RLW55_13590 [Hyphomicrobium sp. B1]|jgi:hypothetical protein|uniref:hypothetical protein n=1 Tax=unclassified Hyphomicrobium TaxID=2619925 RepID=UPI000213D86C|nr:MULTISPECIES: hypothetical protein [unclassified Hyphomicrobium]CCB65723.1 protein of unknown function [Hyphomicrobium sp. MC1]
MTTQSVERAEGAAWDDARASGTLTVGWFVRRSALWMGIMFVALVLACTLYGVASQVGADGARIPRAPSPEFKV